MEPNLAIVIPAYKAEYLHLTLDSLVDQTCQDFRVYVGDDSSPNDIRAVVDRYRGKLNITYRRFEENLGGKNLVAQWERCIDMSKEEEYIWLFSDDDIMDPNCVEVFYENVRKHKADIYRFNVSIIDSDNKVIREVVLPEHIDSKEFYIKKIKAEINCFVVEFVFSRKIYEEVGHFAKFDLAWGSDLATWINMCFKNGIRTLNDARVRWRSSDINISSIQDGDILTRKIRVLGDFFRWGNKRFVYDRKIVRVNDNGFLHRVSTMAIYGNPADAVDSLKSYAISGCHKCVLISKFWFFYIIKKYVLQRHNS